MRGDDVDLRDIGFLGGKKIGFMPAARAELDALFEARVHGTVAEKVAVEVELGRHDDCVEVEPPDPLGFGKFVEGVDDSRELGPDLYQKLPLAKRPS